MGALALLQVYGRALEDDDQRASPYCTLNLFTS